ncbi:MAG TPA: biotin/lipoyl-containing protein [Gemmatimonadota bacterium]|nr:biotin/lipoyl-containing protein [Gemmatimonadota bacterium]
MSGERRWYVTPAGDDPYLVVLRPRHGGWEATVERADQRWTFALAAGQRDGEAWSGSRPIRYRGDAATGRLALAGWVHELRVESEILHRVAELGLAGDSASRAARILAPMPGLVLAVEVEEGDMVRAGEGLLIIEAMKMENEIRAPVDGVVRELTVTAGDAIERDALLCVVDPGEDP